jgi:pimeloyl-ACP methyl ester carboxylesterase
MPYTCNGDVRIYYEVEGQGPPLMFGHGATGNSQSWRTYGYVEQFVHDYTVILFDTRGHGQSDKPHAVEEYDYRLLVGDALAVLDALHVDSTNFWGYSMGGTLGFGLAKHAPQRIRSLIVGGTSPYADTEPITNPPSPLLQAMHDGVRDGPDAVVRGVRAQFGDISPHYEARLRSLDYQAQVALLEYLQYHLPGLEDVLSTMTMPCLVYMAEEDDPGFTHVQSYVEQMPNARFFGVPGNHVNANTNLAVIMPKVREFLAQI